MALRSEEIFCSPVLSCVPVIFRIGYEWEETPENVESKVANAAISNFDFNHNKFEELTRGYADSEVRIT